MTTAVAAAIYARGGAGRGSRLHWDILTARRILSIKLRRWSRGQAPLRYIGLQASLVVVCDGFTNIICSKESHIMDPGDS